MLILIYDNGGIYYIDESEIYEPFENKDKGVDNGKT